MNINDIIRFRYRFEVLNNDKDIHSDIWFLVYRKIHIKIYSTTMGCHIMDQLEEDQEDVYQ